MARDVMYYFDKKSPFARQELGEIQTDFNMGLTIDGSKDSMQVQVYGFLEHEITPNTILLHQATNTWWVVSRDIVRRNAHEKNYWYTHNLTLVGAIDLLNARDLTDSGYNDDTYTIDQFIKRLFKLSTFEFPLTINYGNNIDENKNVDYIKSFENYTLLSALREFLNGYNCDAKLTFTTSGSDNHVNSAILHIIPRTGNVDLPQIDISEFDDIRETKTMNKESYGTTVISNAQNVASTLAKTYPQVGGISLTGDQYNTPTKDLFFRVPTPIYDVVWLRAMGKVRFRAYGGTGINATNVNGELFYPQSRAAFDKAYNDFVELCNNGEVHVHFGPHTQEQLDYMYKVAIGVSQITFYNNGFDYNIHTHQITKKEETPYLPLMQYGSLISEMRIMVLTDKQTRDGMYEGSLHGLYWERGGNKIDGFQIFFNDGQLDHATETKYAGRTDLKTFGISSPIIPVDSSSTPSSLIFSIGYGLAPMTNTYEVFNKITRHSTMWQLNYIPMSDIKIKYDNSRNDIDSKLYNQNGKLNDSVALSKLIDSHSKEIQSDNITRYMHYTNISDIPQIGSLVNKGNEKYVINNISYDFYVNETNNDNNVGYYIECEFTLSKYISVKSLMVNPNSNIRDYGIPQKYNVKRRQVYRDFYEFSLSEDELANKEIPYVPLNNYIVIGTNVDKHEYDHTAIIKIDYKELVDGHESWFYQLNSTAYVMNKSIYEIVDFNDNNIIGYDMQNAKTGFNMSNLYDETIRNITTPISYVDDDGLVKGITLQMVNSTNISQLYENILTDYGNFDTQSLSSHVFVGENFYYGKYTDGQVSEEPNSFSSQSLSDYLSNESGNTIIKIPLNELTYDNDGVLIDTVVIDDVGSIAYVPRLGALQYGNIGSYSIITENDIKYLRIVDTSGTHVPLMFSSFIVDYDVSYTYRTYTYRGAIDLKDYEIKELNYEKDAIEVPVFEYILQLGDTEEVEIGDRILDTQSGVLQMYTCEIRQPNTTTQLNASKVFSGLDISGDTYTGDNYDRQVEIADTSAVDISFENNNTIMRIKVYDNQVALFYGNADQDFDYQSTQVSTTQLPKSYLLGKDIVIYKNVIKSMAYDINEDVATCDYDNELMFIIHNPQESNFDGDDLLVNINYYRLK